MLCSQVVSSFLNSDHPVFKRFDPSSTKVLLNSESLLSYLLSFELIQLLLSSIILLLLKSISIFLLCYFLLHLLLSLQESLSSLVHLRFLLLSHSALGFLLLSALVINLSWSHFESFSSGGKSCLLAFRRSLSLFFNFSSYLLLRIIYLCSLLLRKESSRLFSPSAPFFLFSRIFLLKSGFV